MEYRINKGIGKELEFKGLSTHYLFILAGGLVGVFFLFVVMYLIGINQWICIVCGIISASVLVIATFRLNKKYGEHGLMKSAAAKRHPRRIINRRRIGAIVRSNHHRIQFDNNVK